MCSNCGRGQGDCCDVADYAPRFARTEEIRRLINSRYDWVMARRDLSREDDPVAYSRREGAHVLTYPLPNPYMVDAMFNARLYHDVTCGCPRLRWGNSNVSREEMTAVDVRYRGSKRHAEPTLEDHLIVLAGGIINAVWTFPSTEAADEESGAGGGICGTGWARNIGGAWNLLKGRTVSRQYVNSKTSA